ncbi:mitochondrial ribosomal protein S11 [Cricetulus griseus]
MQVVRNTGAWLLRSWSGPGLTRLVAIAPAQTIHTGVPRLEDAAAKQEVEKQAAPSRFSTQIQVVSAANVPLARASCGTEGFRNAKKGTGIAAQTAGIAAAAKATGKGVTHIRVVVKGMGPGRWLLECLLCTSPGNGKVVPSQTSSAQTSECNGDL